MYVVPNRCLLLSTKQKVLDNSDEWLEDHEHYINGTEDRVRIVLELMASRSAHALTVHVVQDETYPVNDCSHPDSNRETGKHHDPSEDLQGSVDPDALA